MAEQIAKLKPAPKPGAAADAEAEADAAVEAATPEVAEQLDLLQSLDLIYVESPGRRR